ncbi:hypothetical protein [Magnetofaba australis]|uniref:hypothetical protein n=1 Tax=Magnetofaba australis TaxID=1472297 RepID=UPI000A19C7BB|nr:hypothetical protein [Magnetofaba australis]
MACGIDKIVAESDGTLRETMRTLMEELVTDHDLDVDLDALESAPEVKALRAELEKFTVWFVHDRLK